MGKIGLLDRILLLDGRFILVFATVWLLYCRPTLTRRARQTAGPAAALNYDYTFSVLRRTEPNTLQFVHSLIIGFLVWLTVGLVPLLVQSLRWPLIHDAPIMHYVAWRLLHGAVPYRDIFDMNLPGVYLIHMAVLKVFGPSDIGWRLFDLLWLTLTNVLLWRFCFPRVRWWSCIAVLLFSAFHLSSGAPGMGQRDYLEFTFLLGGGLLAVSALENGSDRRRLFLSGLLLGYAVSIKPLALLFLMAVACLAVIQSGKKQAPILPQTWGMGGGFPLPCEPGALGRERIREGGQGVRWKARALVPAIVLAGGAIVPLIFTGWLAAIGGLRPFLETFAGVMPLYSKMHDRPFIQYLSEYWPLWLPCLLTIPVSLMQGRPDARRLVLILGVVYGMLHYMMQNKGWLYQLYPLVGFSSALLACIAGSIPHKARRDSLVAAAGLTLFFILTIGSWDSRLNPANALTADTSDTVASLQQDLGSRLRPGDTVQSFDTTGGCSHALMRMNSPLPTRFLCDYLFYGSSEQPYVKQLHGEFMAAMIQHPPAYLVVYRWGWPSGEYERLAKFPELWHWMQENYRIEAARSKYVIYARRRIVAEDNGKSGR